MRLYGQTLLSLFLLAQCAQNVAAEQAVFSAGTVHAGAGEAVSGYLEIAAAGAGTRIPISIIRG
jgi:hypothetical protein